MTIFAAFSGLTIFITCLVLFGLASFTAEHRTKEIGICKVFDAKVFSNRPHARLTILKTCSYRKNHRMAD